MPRDPSHDWDDHVQAQDEAMTAEIAWWKENADRVITVVATNLVSFQLVRLDPVSIDALVEAAAKVVRNVTDRGRDPYE